MVTILQLCSGINFCSWETSETGCYFMTQSCILSFFAYPGICEKLIKCKLSHQIKIICDLIQYISELSKGLCCYAPHACIKSFKSKLGFWLLFVNLAAKMQRNCRSHFSIWRHDDHKQTKKKNSEDLNHLG